MKPKLMLYCAAAGLWLMQGCSKTAVNQPTVKTSPANLKTNMVSGAYGTYQIANVASNLSMEVTGGSLNNGGGVTQYTYYAGGTPGEVNPNFNNQVWNVIDKGNGYYKIMNLRSGKFLAASFPGPQLWQNVDDGSDGQLWQLTHIGFGAYTIINKANGLAVTNQGGSTNAGNAITQESYVNNNKQWWTFTQLTPAAYRDDAVVNFFHRNGFASAAGAFDEGTSIKLANGKVLWITQDFFPSSAITSSGTYPCGTGLGGCNSGLLQPSITNWNPASTPNITTTNSPSKPMQIFAPPSGNNWSWPSHGVEIGTHVYVQSTEGSRTTYAVSNQYLYDMTESTGTSWGAAAKLSVTGMTNQNMASGNPWINWCMGMVRPGDGYVYVFGSYNANGCSTCSPHIDIYAARFAAQGNVLNWTFWNGSSFVANIPVSSMKKIGSAVDDWGSATVSYANGKYVLMSLDPGWANCTGSHNIYTQVSSNPFVANNTNTFSAPKAVFSIPDLFAGQAARFYTAAIHPEFTNGRNELLLTYCLNNSQCGLDDCQNNAKDANAYQVKAVRVPYSLIGL